MSNMSRVLQGLPSESEQYKELKRLSELVETLSKKNSLPKPSNKRTSLPKQLLMLHYLGLIGHYDLSDIKKAKLFSILINADEQNIRKELPNFIGNQLRDIKNEKHLIELSLLFRNMGLDEISKTIERDLVKLRTGK